MKKKHSNRILGRKAHHRKALLRDLSDALITHGSIVTTEAKGKELRKFFEPLVTAAKGEVTLTKRRRLLASLRSKEALSRLFDIAKQNEKRPGGYLRLTHLASNRADAAREVRVDFVEKITS